MAQFDYLFYSFFTTSGVGTTGLTVTCDVRDSAEDPATSLLADYTGQAFDAEIKAIFGSVSKTVWSGSCFITPGIIRTI